MAPVSRRRPIELRAFGEKIEKLEARIGVEPTNKGFADLCLTTWLPRLIGGPYQWIPWWRRKCQLPVCRSGSTGAFGRPVHRCLGVDEMLLDCLGDEFLQLDAGPSGRHFGALM